MPRVARLVQLDEEFLGVAIEAAFAHLVGRDLDEGVVAAFLAHAQLKRAQVSTKRTLARGVTRALHLDLGKEFVRYPEHFCWDELCSKEMTHVLFQVPGSLAGLTPWIQSTRSSGMRGSLSRRNWIAAAQSPVVAKNNRPE